MSDSVDPTAAVRAALAELQNLLSRRNAREHRGWNVEAADFSAVWHRLASALSDVADLIHQPENGRGLTSMWLATVARIAAGVENEVERWPRGWNDVLQLGCWGLTWLLNYAGHAGDLLATGGVARDLRIGGILKPKSTPLARLRDLANEWKDRFQNAPREPYGMELIEVGNAWRPWGVKRHEYLRSAGTLIIEAVDSLEINEEYFNNENFAELVLSSLSAPWELSSTLLKSDQTASALLDLIDRLAPPPSNEEPAPQQILTAPPSSHEPPAAPITANRPYVPYPTPATYARDMWIYENIHLHTRSALSLELEKRAVIELWELVTSRNGLKESADRYAVYHGLELRAFKGGTRKSE